MKYAIVCAGGPATEIVDLTQYILVKPFLLVQIEAHYIYLKKGLFRKKRLEISILFQGREYERIKKQLNGLAQYHVGKR